MEKPYPRHCDCVWLAVDRDGHVGAFVTAGAGPIPTRVLDSEAIIIDDIESEIYGLPRVTKVHLLSTVPRPDDFVAMASRGLFVYDWSDVHRLARDAIGGYEPMAIPLVPITVDALPDEMAYLFANLKLDAVSFSDGRVLDVRQHVQCREGE